MVERTLEVTGIYRVFCCGARRAITLDGTGISAVKLHFDIVHISADTRHVERIGINRIDGHDAVSATGDSSAETQRPGIDRDSLAVANGTGSITDKKHIHQLAILVQSPSLAELGRHVAVVDEFARYRDQEIGGRGATGIVVTVNRQILEREFSAFATHAIIGLNTEAGALAIDIAIGSSGAPDTLFAGIEQVEQEITVALASPAPVDVEAALAIIAVTDERMSARSLVATIYNGAACGQLGIDDFLPIAGGIVVAPDKTATVLVAKVINQCAGHIARIGARRGQTEVGFQRRGTVQHERRDSISGCAQGIISIIGVLHLVPCEVDRRQRRHVDRIGLAATGCVSGNGDCGTGRILVVSHHLCHRCGDTARVGVGIATATDVGKTHVVRATLTPMHIEHRLNGSTHRGTHLGRTTGSHGLNLAVISNEPFLQNGWHIGRVKRALVTISQNCRDTVITGNNHKALSSLCEIEHIVGVPA